MEGGQMIHVDGASLSRHIQDDELVLVDFWATWCAPCRAMAPMLDRLAKDFPGLRIVKLDAEEHKDLLDSYNVRSLPTLQIYRAGERVDQLMGKVPYEMIRRAVQGAS
ncbi:thioredoxin family protein [Duganella aceris]|nr:thioredoxin family protein [Duganella aceris]